MPTVTPTKKRTATLPDRATQKFIDEWLKRIAISQRVTNFAWSKPLPIAYDEAADGYAAFWLHPVMGLVRVGLLHDSQGTARKRQMQSIIVALAMETLVLPHLKRHYADLPEERDFMIDLTNKAAHSVIHEGNQVGWQALFLQGFVPSPTFHDRGWRMGDILNPELLSMAFEASPVFHPDTYLSLKS
jgi:hypothetical protein